MEAATFIPVLKFMVRDTEINQTQYYNLFTTGMNGFSKSFVMVLKLNGTEHFNVYWRLRNSARIMWLSIKELNEEIYEKIEMFFVEFLLDTLKQNRVGR